ncbi:MAG: Asp23/Gls24 family envelope stress response protein [Clostridia bacterium]|nr:Asp23/Gls24 family envelope stress response protein [Clostridia bacterium]
MFVKTKNVYGQIAISNKSIAKFVAHVAADCYGVVEFVPQNVFHTIMEFLCRGSIAKGVRVKTVGDRIFIDLSVIVKYGVSIKAVAESLKESIKYKVEGFTGMVVDTVNINVMGIRL